MYCLIFVNYFLCNGLSGTYIVVIFEVHESQKARQMKRIHFIAIGGAAMHSLALALHHKGYKVTGSDDNIFEPSHSRLKSAGLLPKRMGWNPENIRPDLDAVILGMHAREDNPELRKAKELQLQIYSYPEFLYEQTRHKKRIVIAGSHGKTTITAMILHVLKKTDKKFDYMVGSKLFDFENTVELDQKNDIAIFEGDEYLSSVLDPRPKFHLYQPHIAIINGIAWDHINVFPTFEIYKKQFNDFILRVEDNGIVCYYENDKTIKEIAQILGRSDIQYIPYSKLKAEVNEGVTFLVSASGKKTPIKVFGDHNLQNLAAAFEVCKQLKITEEQFHAAISTFRGTARRLELLAEGNQSKLFFDFAHSPSKVEATIQSVRRQFPEHQLITCLELHTFSSLNKKFLEEYAGTLDKSDLPMIYYNPDVISSKGLLSISPDEIKTSFNRADIEIYTDNKALRNSLSKLNKKRAILLLMSSGNFGGIDLKEIGENLTAN